MNVTHISAVTLAVSDMARAISFYKKLGFTLTYGSDTASFSTLQAGDAFVNLSATPNNDQQWWGRVIFRVEDADAHHRALVEAGLPAESPRNASWGERYFHITDPDGHELSFAQLLSKP